MTRSPGTLEYLLALADDEHLIGQRHTEWIGTGPFLEEDLALTSIAQDELGHAAALYELVDADVDRLAFLRDPAEYRSCHLVEHPGTDWADTIVRHWLYDLAERHRWEAVADGTDHALTAVAARALREETYHRRHAAAMIDRLASGTAESRARIEAGLATMLPLAAGLFEPVAGEAEARADGTTRHAAADLFDAWWTEVAAELERLGLPADRPAPTTTGGRTTRSAPFAALHADITEVLALDPTGRW